MINIKAKIKEYIRIMQIARKPGKDEFVISAKVCALGMIVVGLIGFLIFITFILSGI